MTRQSYRLELASSVTLPVALALAEGNVLGILAKKSFAVGSLQLTLIVASPMLSNLVSSLWERASRGRRRVQFLTALHLAALVGIAAIGALPLNDFGGWTLTALVVATRCVIAGTIVLRSVIWRYNYPREVRGQMTARLVVVRSIILFLVPLLGSFIMQANQTSFRFVYPMAALVGACGLVGLSRIRMRHEAALLSHERESRREAILGRVGGAASSPGSLAILRADGRFRQYMLLQFVSGSASMLVAPAVVDLVTIRTAGMRWDFVLSTVLAQSLPALFAVISTPTWGRILDGCHIAQFRVQQSFLWAAAFLVMGAGALWTTSAVGGLLVFAMGRLLFGAANGGSDLAWLLGHNDFASKEISGAYMGAHVTLTGVRGAIVPLFGMVLYGGWADQPWGLPLPGFHGFGAHIFWIAAALSLAAMAGFSSLYDRIEQRSQLAALSRNTIP